MQTLNTGFSEHILNSLKSSQVKRLNSNNCMQNFIIIIALQYLTDLANIYFCIHPLHNENKNSTTVHTIVSLIISSNMLAVKVDIYNRSINESKAVFLLHCHFISSINDFFYKLAFKTNGLKCLLPHSRRHIPHILDFPNGSHWLAV